MRRAAVVLSLVVGCDLALGDQAPFAEIDWRAISVDGFPPRARNAVWLRIDGGTVHGSLSCTRYEARAVVDAGRLYVTDVATASDACDESASRFDTTFLAVLQTGPSIERTGHLLRLESGEGFLVFTDQPLR